MSRPRIAYQPVTKDLLIINVLLALFYFSWWLDSGRISQPWLYGLLLFGELYHLIMAFTFWFTIRPGKTPTPEFDQRIHRSVDVFIPVAGEPLEVVRETVRAAKWMGYPGMKIYILNDGYVAKKANWQEMERLARYEGVECLTRRIPGGAKAGNINHALQQTSGELIALFDADMVPARDFLRRTVPYFVDPTMGFVQSPQYYQNFDDNAVTSGAWDQQKFFFGPILRGKNQDNASFICGTNVVIRRQALAAVGGMVSDNIAEDFLTSLQIHQLGWKSHYVPEVLAQGLAPADLGSYYKQQFRWARGSLEVCFKENPLFKRGLTWAQKIHYLSSALYYLNGLIILIDIVMPLIYLFTGIQPVLATTTSFAIFFIPFMFLNLLTLQITSGHDISFNTYAFSYASWFLQLSALVSLLSGTAVSFAVTPKEQQKGVYMKLALPHLLYVIATVAGSVMAFHREGLGPSVATNIAWAAFNSLLFLPYILIAFNAYPFRPALTSPIRVAST